MAQEIGNISTVVIQPTLVVSLGAYTALDVLGTDADNTAVEIPLALRAGVASGVLNSITVYDADNEKSGIGFLFFNADPTGGTYADNGALTWGSGDGAKLLGLVKVLSSDYTTVGSDAVATVRNIGLPVKAAAGATSLFVIPFAIDTPTYTAVTDLQVAFGFLRD